MKRVLSLLICMMLGAMSEASAAPAPTGTGMLPLTQVAGGTVLDPVIADDIVYIPSGRIISAWDYANPAAPVLLASTGNTPTNGVIRGLTRWGNYLYASWQAGDDSGGVAVYSLGDPRHPALVNQFSDYAPEYKSLWTLAAANGYLYLFDSENGIFYGDLGPDPLHPTFTRLLRTPVSNTVPVERLHMHRLETPGQISRPSKVKRLSADRSCRVTCGACARTSSLRFTRYSNGREGDRPRADERACSDHEHRDAADARDGLEQRAAPSHWRRVWRADFRPGP